MPDRAGAIAATLAGALGSAVRMLSRHGLSGGDISVVERVVTTVGPFVVKSHVSAQGGFFHGDLWAGNLHVASNGAPALIDPSCYFAHREAELGMTTLFGGFGARVYEVYDAEFGLDAGWRERTPIYQLYHLLNHLNLFGGGYRAQVMAITNRFV